ncbi:MAG: condensation domain-containing protein [Rhizobiaceae bacterium]
MTFLRKSGFQTVPLSAFQRAFLPIFAQDDVTPYYRDKFLLRWAFLVTPRLDQLRVSRAFDQLVARHDCLRLQFEWIANGWRTVLADRHRTGLIVEDIGEVSKMSLDAIVQAQAAADMDLFSDCLFEVRILKAGRQGDVLIIRANHMIMDGYGAVIFFEDLINLLMGLPFHDNALKHEKFVKLEEIMLRMSSGSKEEYWTGVLLPLDQPLNIGRVKKGMPLASSNEIVRAIEMQDVIDPAQLRSLEKRAHSLGATLMAYLAAAFGEVLCELGDAESVTMDASVGRLDAAIAKYVGPTVGRVYIRHMREGAQDLDKSAQVKTNDIRSGIAHLPWNEELPVNNKESAHTDDPRGVRGRFRIHIAESIGRMRSSSHSQFFELTRAKGISVGPFHIERIDLASEVSVMRELELRLSLGADGYSLSLGADADAFEVDELAAICSQLSHKLGVT